VPRVLVAQTPAIGNTVPVAAYLGQKCFLETAVEE
jgi:hypothetical protein